MGIRYYLYFFFFNDTATTEIYTLSLHDALPIFRVKTQGINETVLKELREKYGDGITFEVWNYFKSEAITREQLQPMLNNSTIKFTAVPDRYVNAFGAVYNYNDGESPVYSKLENEGKIGRASCRERV